MNLVYSSSQAGLFCRVSFAFLLLDANWSIWDTFYTRNRIKTCWTGCKFIIFASFSPTYRLWIRIIYIGWLPKTLSISANYTSCLNFVWLTGTQWYAASFYLSTLCASLKLRTPWMCAYTLILYKIIFQ